MERGRTCEVLKSTTGLKLRCRSLRVKVDKRGSVSTSCCRNHKAWTVKR